MEPFQYAEVRFIRDKGLVLALHQRDAPGGGFDVSGINRTLQNLPDALLVDSLVGPVEEAGGEVEIAFDLALRTLSTVIATFSAQFAA